MSEKDSLKAKNGKKIFIVLVVLIILIIALSGLFSGNSPNEKNIIPMSYVAVLSVDGVISPEDTGSYNHQWLLETIEELKSDKSNKGIILKINSPGGSVYESDELYLALKSYGENKILVAYMENMAASGGYYISCAAERIYANRNTLTGSIGVISGQSIDLTGLFSNLGIKYTTITSGKNKNMGNVNEPLTKEQQDILQGISDEVYQQFTGIVSDERGLPLEDVIKIADGRIYTANQAQKLGLIDQIGTLEDVKQYIRDNYDPAYKNIQFVDFEYENNDFLLSILKKYGIVSFMEGVEGLSSIINGYDSQNLMPAYLSAF